VAIIITYIFIIHLELIPKTIALAGISLHFLSMEIWTKVLIIKPAPISLLLVKLFEYKKNDQSQHSNRTIKNHCHCPGISGFNR